MPTSRIPQPLLSGRTREFPIEVLLSGLPPVLHEGERALLNLVLPPWQRPEVWDGARKRRFVEGIFLGLGTGFYVVTEMDWDASGRKAMSGWLLDGQQRLSALRDFCQGRIEIFDGVRFGDLDLPTLRRRFLHVVFPCIELPYTDDERSLKELYARLNFSGVPHTEEDRDRLTFDAAQPASARLDRNRPQG